MKVALFGGTGHVSQLLIDELLSNGFKVRLLTRQPEFRFHSIEVVHGDALNLDDVSHTLEGCSAVVNCIGRLKNEGSFYSSISENILQAMVARGLRRYILVTNSTTKTPEDKDTIWSWGGSMIFRIFFPEMLEDKETESKKVKNSDVDWTILRLPLVLKSGKLKTFITSQYSLDGFLVSAKTVARSIVVELKNVTNYRKMLFVYE